MLTLLPYKVTYSQALKMRLWTPLAGALLCLPWNCQARSPRRGDLRLPGRPPSIPLLLSLTDGGQSPQGLTEHSGRDLRGSFSQLPHEASRRTETWRSCATYIRMQSRWKLCFSLSLNIWLFSFRMLHFRAWLCIVCSGILQNLIKFHLFYLITSYSKGHILKNNLK